MNERALGQTRLDAMKPDLAYRVGLLAVAILVLLLPLIYFALVGAVGWTLVWHLTENTHLGWGRVNGWILAYLAPAVAGAGLLGFLLKPLIATRRPTGGWIRLSSDSASGLRGLIDDVCATVGTPSPREIRLDVDVNASAGFHEARGLRSSDRVLRVGLPLVGGLTRTQLAHVLAHEFGHFAQRWGMSLHYLIRTVLGWFARAVHGRDAWDETLAKAGKNDSGIVVVTAWLLKGGVWVSRRILSGLLYVGAAAAEASGRRMEFDADRYGVEVAGSDALAATQRRMATLAVARAAAMDDLERLWLERRLPDDLVGLSLWHDERRGEEHDAEALARLESERTTRFDTHPAYSERVAAAERLARPGLYRDDRPARGLLDDFEDACRLATVAYYRHVGGRSFREDYVVPVADVVDERTERVEATDAARRYFHDCIGFALPWPLRDASIAALPEPREAALELKQLRDRARKRSRREELDAERLDRLERLEQAFLQAEAKKRAGVDAGLDEIGVPAHEVDSRALATAIELDELRERHRPLLEENARRLELAVRLLHAEPVAGRVDGGDALRERIGRVWPVLVELARRPGEPAEATSAAAVIPPLVDRLAQHGHDERLAAEIRRADQTLRELLDSWHTRFAALDYPFEHGRGRISVQAWVLPALPRRGDVGALLTAAVQAADKLRMLRWRCLAFACAAAERVESALGLPPLPVPVPLSEDEEHAVGIFPSSKAGALPTNAAAELARRRSTRIPRRSPRPTPAAAAAPAIAAADDDGLIIDAPSPRAPARSGRTALARGRRRRMNPTLKVALFLGGGLLAVFFLLIVVVVDEVIPDLPPAQRFTTAWDAADDQAIAALFEEKARDEDLAEMRQALERRGWTAARPRVLKPWSVASSESRATWQHDLSEGWVRSVWSKRGGDGWKLIDVGFSPLTPATSATHAVESFVAAWMGSDVAELRRQLESATPAARADFESVVAGFARDRLPAVQGWRQDDGRDGVTMLSTDTPPGRLRVRFAYWSTGWRIEALRWTPRR